MPRQSIFDMAFASVYPHYINKAERKGRTREEVDTLIHWLTGYDQAALAAINQSDISFRAFFDQAPAMNAHRQLITGVVCGVRVEDIEDPLMREIRYLDKLIDELARGKALNKIMRQPK